MVNSYLELMRVSPTDRIQMIRAVPTVARAKALAHELGIAESILLNDLGIPAKAGNATRLPVAASERLLGLMTMIGRVDAMVLSMDASIEFDAARWLGSWLNSPLPALGGARPGSYLDTMTGQEMLAALLEMARSGAYA